ncbi:ATP synthase F1 subunit delta [Lachnoanaerobaculum gingivalis]|jgi:ATP synthase F1, delta subunit|uniref:ATP synthase subunit delta n=1 Tax=Lachnoanaerobaculum gingivalis TaxID=2490855 RepID=A0A3P3QX29_9FIRM|nr:MULTISPECIES: ATP synthase F1 subunit delta [Lachnoanaerobaculum]EJZ69741.1 ATP synthase F1, delta subunit [Lachnoanaerobaculum sp. OBRC5-5]RRJ25674.1 ATP synthase F1 subunit delta [Lachnoanaerobaculum gingivalis]WHE87501.1 ATP synthase F1 subunit delta [Lachnoanaerobaculum gingivalis]
MAKLVSKVYGDAYVSVVSEKNNLIDALEEIKSVKNILLENVEIIELLDSPKMDDEEKIDFIKGIFENHISVDSLGFLLTIIEKKRQAELIPILDYVIDCVKELLLIGKATVTTALPLDDSKKERIVDELLKSSHYKSLEVEYVVDESIIGGIVIRIGDRVVDSSVKTRIDKMRKMLS